MINTYFFERIKKMKHFFSSCKCNVNRRLVDDKKNKRKRIICQHHFICITIIENNIMVHTTATTLHLHYDLEKAGYRGI